MSEPRDDGGPALPRQVSDVGSGYPGMTLLDHFAGQALMGLLANPRWVEYSGGSIDYRLTTVLAVEGAYRVADAMLAERKKRATP